MVLRSQRDEARSKHQGETTMKHYAGIDVSLECSSVCVVDTNGKILREARVASEPEALIAWFASLGFGLERIGLEAGPLSQWLFAAMRQAGLAVELLETRHVRKAFEAMPVKSDRNDARGIAQLMRLGGLVAGHPHLQVIAKALLSVRAVLRSEFAAFEKQVRKMARSDMRTRLLMSTPAVGPIVALTYASAIDDPTRFKSSKQAGAHFGLTPKKYQSGETDYTGRIR